MGIICQNAVYARPIVSAMLSNLVHFSATMMRCPERFTEVNNKHVAIYHYRNIKQYTSGIKQNFLPCDK